MPARRRSRSSGALAKGQQHVAPGVGAADLHMAPVNAADIGPDHRAAIGERLLNYHGRVFPPDRGDDNPVHPRPCVWRLGQLATGIEVVAGLFLAVLRMMDLQPCPDGRNSAGIVCCRPSLVQGTRGRVHGGGREHQGEAGSHGGPGAVTRRPGWSTAPKASASGSGVSSGVRWNRPSLRRRRSTGRSRTTSASGCRRCWRGTSPSHARNPPKSTAMRRTRPCIGTRTGSTIMNCRSLPG